MVMNLFNNKDLFRKRVSPAHYTYGLTPLGKTKAEQYTVNTPQAQVLSYLNENGVSTVSDIAGEIRKSPEVTKLIIRQLLRNGWIRKIGEDG